MRVIHKYRFEIIWFLIISIIYFGLRIPNLTLQPIFVDEAIYIRWAQIMKAEPTLRFISLQDGKTPFFMWAMIPFFKIFSDPLFAGRFLSIISGYLTMLGLLFLGWKFFNTKIGIWAAFLYAISPLTVFFDRMALVDSLMASFSIWSLNLALLLVKFPRFDLAMVLGYFLGGAILTKTPGILNLVALPSALFTFNFARAGREKRALRLFGLGLLAIAITFVIYNILRLGPGFSNLNSRNGDYVRNPADLLIRPWDPFLPHLNDLVDWSFKLLGIPFLIFMFMGVWRLILKGVEGKRVFLLAVIFWGLIPLLIQMVLLRTFTTRYILFCIIPGFILAACGIDYLLNWVYGFWVAVSKKIVLLILILFLLSWPIYFDIQLLLSPAMAPLPENERMGYFEVWTAGYGFKEIAHFLIEQSNRRGVIVVGTEGSFGTLPDGLTIYLDKYSHSAPEDKKIVVLGDSSSTVSAQLKGASLEHPTFFVANRSRLRGIEGNLKLIKEYPKAISPLGTQDAILFFELIPENVATVSGRMISR